MESEECVSVCHMTAPAAVLPLLRPAGKDSVSEATHPPQEEDAFCWITSVKRARSEELIKTTSYFYSFPQGFGAWWSPWVVISEQRQRNWIKTRPVYLRVTRVCKRSDLATMKYFLSTCVWREASLDWLEITWHNRSIESDYESLTRSCESSSVRSLIQVFSFH